MPDCRSFILEAFDPGIGEDLLAVSECTGTTWTLHAPQAIHDHVEEILAVQRKQKLQQIDISIKVFDIREEHFFQLRMDPRLTWVPDHGPTRSVSARADESIIKVIDDIIKYQHRCHVCHDAQIDRLQWPASNSTFINQYAHLAAPTIEGAYPRVQVENTGSIFDVRATLTNDQRLIQLHFKSITRVHVASDVIKIPNPNGPGTLTVEECDCRLQQILVDRPMIPGQGILIAPDRTAGLEQKKASPDDPGAGDGDRTATGT